MRGSWVETHNLQMESEFHRTCKKNPEEVIGNLKDTYTSTYFGVPGLYRPNYFNKLHVVMAIILYSWKVHDWSTSKLRLNDFWAHEKLEPHIRHWSFILSWARKVKLSWANYERIMRGSWVGEPRTPKEINLRISRSFSRYHWKLETKWGGPHFCFPICITSYSLLIYWDCLWTDSARIVACWVRKLNEEGEFQSKSIPSVPMDMRSSPSMSCSWEVHERFMSGSWVGEEWLMQRNL